MENAGENPWKKHGNYDIMDNSWEKTWNRMGLVMGT